MAWLLQRSTLPVSGAQTHNSPQPTERCWIVEARAALVHADVAYGYGVVLLHFLRVPDLPVRAAHLSTVRPFIAGNITLGITILEALGQLIKRYAIEKVNLSGCNLTAAKATAFVTSLSPGFSTKIRKLEAELTVRQNSN